jgi:hypothetical protein
MSGIDLTAVERADVVEPDGPAESITSLVRFAIANNVGVDVLERLVALQERVTERNARTAFVEALTKFREDCPPVTKTRENTQFKVTRGGVSVNAMYAPLDEIDRVARPVAAGHGLVWTWNTSVDDKLMHVTCRLIHVLGHSEETNVSMPYESKAGSSPQQKYGSTQTYGMRYSLIAALGLTTADEDTDGAGSAGEKISDEQLADLESLLEEVGADRLKFLAFMGTDTLAGILASDYKRAVTALERKRR